MTGLYGYLISLIVIQEKKGMQDIYKVIYELLDWTEDFIIKNTNSYTCVKMEETGT